jgi:hypothetical protein
MVSYKVFERGIEVNGSTIMVVIAGFGDFKILADRALSSAGLHDIENDPNSWYPQQAWLDAFKAISDKVGASILLKIGKEIPEHAELPPSMNNIEEVLKGIDVAYHMNHRNARGEILFDPNRAIPMLEGIGHYAYEKIGENKANMVCENPYPCDFDLGLINSFAKKFAPLANVTHDESKPCRNDGANSCTYIIEW